MREKGVGFGNECGSGHLTQRDERNVQRDRGNCRGYPEVSNLTQQASWVILIVRVAMGSKL